MGKNLPHIYPQTDSTILRMAIKIYFLFLVFKKNSFFIFETKLSGLLYIIIIGLFFLVIFISFLITFF